MFIDIHAHAYLFPSPPQDGHTQFCTPEELLRRYDELDIERGVLLPLVGPEVYMPQSNQEILECCRLHPERLLPFCNIDPRGIKNSPLTDFSPWLNWYKENGCLGVGEFMPNLSFMDPLVQNFFQQINDMGWPLTFDVTVQLGRSYGLVDQPGQPLLEFCLQRYPRMIILGHGPAFWSEMGTLDTVADRATYPRYPIRAEGVVPKLLRRYDNLWGDLSAGSGYNALARDPDYAIGFLNEFQDKLCFGTDLCTADGELPLAPFLLDLKKSGHISEKVFMKIARENAIRLLGL
ncbi:MAG: amidohydrolase family protein [Lentisphaeria bacterium]|jgi:predicted TIM-barrel fold metal-dependent hydrolase|nr:amidohydrolase family protein [Lentisphaeria bacterium]MDY0177325.1 amidohydrolase family protein [Lentisphaeria bacterium]